MSRSFHHTRKSASRAFKHGDLEPTKEYSLKSDTKRWSKKLRAFESVLDKASPKVGAQRRKRGLRNSALVSSIKKVKKPLNRKLDSRFAK